MKLIVGLGNPKKNYADTRHSVGQEIVRGFVTGSFHLMKKVEAEVGKKEGVVFAAPTTFMNESGRSVAKLCSWFEVPLSDTWVVHDDVDFPFGIVRIQVGGGDAGHKGVRSIIQSIGEEFVRFRIGIGHPLVQDVDQFVLSPFTKEERQQLPKMLKRVRNVISYALDTDIGKAMNRYNTKEQ